MKSYDDLSQEQLEQVYEKILLEDKQKREQRLGRPLGEWGGKRKGSGRPKVVPFNHVAKLNLNDLQKKVLKDMGEGSISAGIQALINENM